MTRKIALLMTILLLAIAVLATSFAWFANNTELFADKTTMVAGKEISTSVDYRRVESGKYNGETGRGASFGDARDEDAPYSVEFYVFMSNTTLGKECFLFVDMKKLLITRGDPEVPPYLAESSELSKEFTWRFHYAGKQYEPDAEGLAVSVENGSYFVVPEGSITLAFELIYLSEDRYLQWQSDCERSHVDYLNSGVTSIGYLEWVKTQSGYFNYAEFGFCNPKYMNSTFYFDLGFGIVADGEESNA